jgi:hypothetical protein
VFQSGAWSLLGSRTDSTYTAAGKIGVKINDSGLNGRFDDFGGGTVVGGAPSPSLRTVQSNLRW